MLFVASNVIHIGESARVLRAAIGRASGRGNPICALMRMADGIPVAYGGWQSRGVWRMAFLRPDARPTGRAD